jgi:osmoprotectant transport system permease protein
LGDRLGIAVMAVVPTLGERLLARTGEHLLLVGVSLALAILAAVPLGVLAVRVRWLGQVVLGAVGIVQTIPALALLFLLSVALHRLGVVPAMVALFFYSLLPIVRNTYTGLRDIPLPVRESAEALGLSGWARLRLVELPLAAPAILAGVKTAAIINIGNATLGGLIAAGGFGTPIIIGLNKSNLGSILEGTIPAVLMALLAQALFEVAERFLVSPGLRLRPVE